MHYVTLICPTLKSLKMIIKICEDYASEYNVAFNGNTSKLMFFKGRECVKPVSVSGSVNGNTVECETEADHLGHRVSSQGSDNLVKSTINSFWRGFNFFAAEFGDTYGFVKCKLFKQYCCSFMDHNDIIATMSEMLPLEIKLNYHFAKFYNKCKSHES